MLTTLAITNYRSIRNLVVPLERLTVITGANGVGKSSLYRALHLLVETALGAGVATLAKGGGLPAVLWAGPEKIGAEVRAGTHAVEGVRRSDKVRLRLGFAAEDFGYTVDYGLPPPSDASPPPPFNLDPQIKHECIFAGQAARPATRLVERRGAVVRIRGDKWSELPLTLAPFESMMTHCADPRSAPEVLEVRERMRAWRFYDHFRTDREAPARFPQIGTRTPVLAHDGADLAAALLTIIDIGDRAALSETIEDAFPGSTISVHETGGLCTLSMHQHGLLRPLSASDLSDGTLRYLLLAAALLSPRAPELLVLNEPETSLHPSLLAPLARLIVAAAKATQIIVVSHAAALTEALQQASVCGMVRLEKEFGETHIAGQGRLDAPPWIWPD